MIENHVRGDSRMPKVLKAKRRKDKTENKNKADNKTKGKDSKDREENQNRGGQDAGESIFKAS